jgi:hypothetical protein
MGITIKTSRNLSASGGIAIKNVGHAHSIARITGGNFRLLHRLFVQIERILKINDLTFITDEVVNAARSTLVIGTT